MEELFGKVYRTIYLTDKIKIRINTTIVNIWIIGAILIALSIFVRFALINFKEKPKGLQNFIEVFVEAMDSFVTGTVGEKYSYLGNWFFGVFAFILFSNLSGLFTLRPPTADLTTNIGLAFTTFFLIHFFGIFTNTKGYLKGYLEPMFLFLPINILGEIAKPVSLSFRLFGVIISGIIILSMVYSLLPVYFHIGLPGALNLYLDVFAGSLQAFIFCILSLTFIKNNTPETD